MNIHILRTSGRGLFASLAVVAALVAGQVVGQTGQTNAAGGDYPFGSDIRAFSLDGSMEASTIPAARPGLPQQESGGAMGPIRRDEIRQYRTDPSIRDTHPLTMNGLWEQHLGNVVTQPGGIPIERR